MALRNHFVSWSCDGIDRQPIYPTLTKASFLFLINGLMGHLETESGVSAVATFICHSNLVDLSLIYSNSAIYGSDIIYYTFILTISGRRINVVLVRLCLIK